MISSADDPTVIKVNRFIEIALEYGQLGNYLVEYFTWMKYIPSSVASWKRLAEERHEEYSDMLVGMLRDVEDRIVITFTLLFSASLTNLVETRGRTLELRWDIDSGTGAPSPERARGRVDSWFNIVLIILYLRLSRMWSMLTSISVAGTETVRSGLVSIICSCCTECFHIVLVHTSDDRVPRSAKEVPRGARQGHRPLSHADVSG